MIILLPTVWATVVTRKLCEIVTAFLLCSGTDDQLEQKDVLVVRRVYGIQYVLVS